MQYNTNRKPFVIAYRDSELASILLRKRPTAFNLLYLIALRARRTTDAVNDGFQVGEAVIGDYASYGATEQIYRTDKKWLERYALATFSSTPRGTIATLTSTDIFDINAEVTNKNEANQQFLNEQTTTNNNIPNVLDTKTNITTLRVQKEAEVMGLPITTIAQKLGISFGSLGQKNGGEQLAHCFNKDAHKNGDQHPSLVLFTNKNRYYCRACQVRGGNIDLVKAVLNCEFEDAMEFLSPGFKDLRGRKERDDFSDYLEKRGIRKETAEKFGLKLGWGIHPGTYKAGKKIFEPRVTIPIVRNSESKKNKYRWINRQEHKYTWTKGANALLFKTVEIPDGVIIVTEGELDSIVLWQNTGYAAWSPTAGAGAFYDTWASDIASHATLVFLCYDNDSAGTLGATNAFKRLTKYIEAEQILFIHLPEGIKDVTEFFLNGHTKENFAALMEQATPARNDFELKIAPSPVRL